VNINSGKGMRDKVEDRTTKQGSRGKGKRSTKEEVEHDCNITWALLSPSCEAASAAVMR